MDKPLLRPHVWRAAQGLASALLIGALLSFVALGSHRPAWWALGVLLMSALVWQGWRHGWRAARWTALGLALGPLTLMVGLDFTSIDWGAGRALVIAAAAALLGGLSFALLRDRPAWAFAALAWHLTLAIPLDFAHQRHPGGPKVQPLSVGLIKPPPTPEQARQFVDAGCFGGGLEPIWAVTWQASTSTP
ncbi:hypothetical protein ACG02S_15410 [Roseateles sp. DC23W]|uniref:Uncharacterized protein n=1 Tax=Pelomonas dachongensis TaxID=3299029 RepID=A0ABW7EQY8_9BURK